MSQPACGSPFPYCLDGACVECLSSLQCPGTGNACTQATCNQGTCGTSPKPSGTSCAGGTCDGAGLCTNCAPGTSVCNGTQVLSCNSSGQYDSPVACGGATPYCASASHTASCVACTSPNHCPAPHNPCLQASCGNNSCGTAPKADGTSCSIGADTGACQSGACSVCTSGATRCKPGMSDLPQACNLGQWVDQASCGVGESCISGTCQNLAPLDGGTDAGVIPDAGTVDAGVPPIISADGGVSCPWGYTLTTGACAPSWVFTYIKASNPDRHDGFGRVALSADGNTMAVGVTDESSDASGVQGDQLNNNLQSSGAVYVFVKNNGSWTQQAYLKASNPKQRALFGYSVALSADGDTLAVGATNENSSATGIDGNQADTTGGAAGAVYVFTRSGSTWTQQAYVKASNTPSIYTEYPAPSEYFGTRVTLSADGNTLAVSAPSENSNATGINTTPSNRIGSPDSGAVYVFVRSGSTWTQQAYIKASNTFIDDAFGSSLALSADGQTLAVGAVGEDGQSPGINGPNAYQDRQLSASGAVYVFARTGSSWAQQAYVKASNPDMDDEFGWAVALSGDGNTLAVGAVEEDSSATGINASQANNSKYGSGAVYLFERSNASWSQQAYVKASNSRLNAGFGSALSFSADGSTLAVAASSEPSVGNGIGAHQTGTESGGSGAVYIFRRSSSAPGWAQHTFIKAPVADPYDGFGSTVSLSHDGTTLAVGTPGEDSEAKGIGGNPHGYYGTASGAVWLFEVSP